MRVTTDDGVSLAVEVTGAGPALVLVHGHGGAKEDFADHVARLATRYRVITFDHRGHGESDGPGDASAYSLERLAEDVRQVADALDAPTFRLLGHSMGGMVARRLVLTTPERVDALVMMDTSPGPIPALDPDLLEAGAVIATDHGMDVLKEILDASSPLDNAAYQRVLAERPGYREFAERKWAALAPMAWATLARAIRDQSDDLAAMAAIACPTLVLVGALDAPFYDVSLQMAAAVPEGQLVVIPDAGHSPQFEAPDVWIAAVEGFLFAVDEARESPAA